MPARTRDRRGTKGAANAAARQYEANCAAPADGSAAATPGRSTAIAGCSSPTPKRAIPYVAAISSIPNDAAEDPREKVLAIFDAVPAFRASAGPTQWCSFLATASERPIADDVPAQLISRDNAVLRDRLGRTPMPPTHRGPTRSWRR